MQIEIWTFKSASWFHCHIARFLDIRGTKLMLENIMNNTILLNNIDIIIIIEYITYGVGLLFGIGYLWNMIDNTFLQN